MPYGPSLYGIFLGQIFGKYGRWGCQERKSSLNIKFSGGIFLGHQGPRRRDIPDKQLHASGLVSVVFRQGVAGISQDLGWDVPDLEKLYARKLWPDFAFPTEEIGLSRAY